MKLIPIDPNNLPDNEVLAYSEIGGAVTGKLMFNPVIDEVICTGGIKSISGVTHYLPLDQIKPESDKQSKEVHFFISMTNGTAQRSRDDWFTIEANESLSKEFYNWTTDKRKEFASDTNTPIEKIVTLSLNCIQFS